MAKQQSKKRASRKKKTEEPEEGNQYDKVMKEGFRRSAVDLLTLFFGMPPGNYAPTHIEYQKTRERRTDFTFKFEAPGLQKKIVHFEVHGKNDKRLVDRQYDTSGLINWHFPSPEWDLVQIVLFIGRRSPTMPTELKKSDIGYRYRLFWVKDFKYEAFLETKIPSLFLLAAIADYGEKSPKDVFIEVVNEAREILRDGPHFDLFIEQLHMLSNVHKLQHIFKEVSMQLSQLIDEKNDPFFQQGKIEGLIEGRIEARIEAKLEAEIQNAEILLDFACRLVRNFNHDITTIAWLARLEEKTVVEIQKLFQEHPADFRERAKKMASFVKIMPVPE